MRSWKCLAINTKFDLTQQFNNAPSQIIKDFTVTVTSTSTDPQFSTIFNTYSLNSVPDPNNSTHPWTIELSKKFVYYDNSSN